MQGARAVPDRRTNELEHARVRVHELDDCAPLVSNKHQISTSRAQQLTKAEEEDDDEQTTQATTAWPAAMLSQQHDAEMVVSERRRPVREPPGVQRASTPRPALHPPPPGTERRSGHAPRPARPPVRARAAAESESCVLSSHPAASSIAGSPSFARPRRAQLVGTSEVDSHRGHLGVHQLAKCDAGSLEMLGQRSSTLDCCPLHDDTASLRRRVRSHQAHDTRDVVVRLPQSTPWPQPDISTHGDSSTHAGMTSSSRDREPLVEPRVRKRRAEHSTKQLATAGPRRCRGSAQLGCAMPGWWRRRVRRWGRPDGSVVSCELWMPRPDLASTTC